MRIFAIAVLSLCATAGCSAAGPSCELIHVADTTCHVLQYTTPAGSVERVPVTTEDLAGLGERVMLRRQAQDAGRE